MNRLKILVQKGMVSIDNDEIAYGNIEEMYQSGDGIGLQLSERLEHKRGEIISLCGEISDKIYELYSVIENKHEEM